MAISCSGQPYYTAAKLSSTKLLPSLSSLLQSCVAIGKCEKGGGGGGVDIYGLRAELRWKKRQESRGAVVSRLAGT